MRPVRCLIILHMFVIFCLMPSAHAEAASISCSSIFLTEHEQPIEGTVLEGAKLRTKSQIASHEFKTGRDLIEYIRLFREEIGLHFLRTLSKLGPYQFWLDGGSGEGIALRSYLAVGSPNVGSPEVQYVIKQIGEKSLSEKASVIGITYSDAAGRITRATPEAARLRKGLNLPANAQGKMRVLVNRVFEEIDPSEIGRVDLITDVWGIFSYSHDPMFVLRRYLDLLNENGSVFIHTDSVNVKFEVDGKIRSLPFAMWIANQYWHGLRIKSNGDWGFSITKLSESYELPSLSVGQMSNGGTPLQKWLVIP